MEEEFEFESADTDALVQLFEEILRVNGERFFDVEEFLVLADYYMVHQELEKSRIALEMALRQHPHSVDLQTCQARLLTRRGMFAQALELLQSIQLSNPENTEVYIRMAQVYSELQEHDRAIHCYFQALKRADKRDRRYLYLDISDEYQSKGDLDRARYYLRKAILLDPYDDVAFMEYIFLIQLENRYREAVKFAKSLTDRDPYNHVAWFYLGLCYQDLDLPEDAIRCFDFAAVIDDTFAEANLHKAECCMEIGIYEEALKALEDAEPHYELRPRLLYMKGECLEQLQRWDEGLMAYKECAELVPGMPEAWIGMSICLQELGRLREGLVYAEQALVLEPENGHFHLVKAGLLRGLGKFGEAEIAYQDVMVKYPEIVETYLELSELYLGMDDLQLVENILLKGLDVDEKHPEILYRLAATYFYKGKKDLGAFWLNQALDRYFKGFGEIFAFIPDLSDNKYISELIQNHPAYGQDSSLYS